MNFSVAYKIDLAKLWLVHERLAYIMMVHLKESFDTVKINDILHILYDRGTYITRCSKEMGNMYNDNDWLLKNKMKNCSRQVEPVEYIFDYGRNLTECERKHHSDKTLI